MAQNKFNFEAFNAATKGAGTGLKLFLSLQLLRDVTNDLEFFSNPLEDDCRGIYTDLKSFRASYKAAAEARATKTGKLMASDGEAE